MDDVSESLIRPKGDVEAMLISFESGPVTVKDFRLVEHFTAKHFGF